MVGELKDLSSNFLKITPTNNQGVVSLAWVSTHWIMDHGSPHKRRQTPFEQVELLPKCQWELIPWEKAIPLFD